jgi:hypothetical protein
MDREAFNFDWITKVRRFEVIPVISSYPGGGEFVANFVQADDYESFVNKCQLRMQVNRQQAIKIEGFEVVTRNSTASIVPELNTYGLAIDECLMGKVKVAKSFQSIIVEDREGRAFTIDSSPKPFRALFGSKHNYLITVDRMHTISLDVRDCGRPERLVSHISPELLKFDKASAQVLVVGILLKVMIDCYQMA